MHGKSIFLIALLISIISCRKDYGPCSQLNDSVDNITIGHSENIETHLMDSTISGGYYYEEAMEIDVDHDGVFDFKFVSSIGGSPAIGGITSMSLICLSSDSYVLLQDANDSLFYSDYYSYFSTDPVYATRTIYKGCNRQTALDSIISVNPSKSLFYLEVGETVSKNDNWKSGSFSLIRSAFSYPPALISENADTIRYRVEEFENNCHAIPSGKDCYIPIKKEVCGTEKLGWITIYKDGASLTIKEYSIQQ